MTQEIALRRYPNALIATVMGVSYELPKNRKAIAAIGVVDSKSYNPLPEDVLAEIDKVIQGYPSTYCPGLKRDFGIARAEVITFFVNFADAHNVSVEKFSRYAPVVTKWVGRVETMSRDIIEPLPISRQMGIALEETQGNITEAVLVLAIGSRAMARGVDTRIVPGLVITDERMLNWKKCVRAFGYENKHNDPPGDTYHLWHGVLAGMSRQEEVDSRLACAAKQGVCDFVYHKTALATVLFRYRIWGKEGKTHEKMDRLGYEVGRAIVGINSNPIL